MALLSGEQVAQILYQVGFRNDEVLAQMTAIARRESSFKSDAVRTNNPGGNTGDYGLFQINSVNLRFLNSIGITNMQQLLDPVTNARAAYALYQRDGMYPWSRWSQRADGSWYASGPPTWNTNIDAARQYVQAARAQGMIGQSYQGGSSQNQVYPMAGAPTTATGPVRLPSDTRLVNVGYNIFAIYDVGGGVKLAYTINTASGAVDWKSHGQLQAMSQDQFNQQAYIMAGDANELGTVNETFGTFKSFWDSMLSRVMGPNNPARNDPEIQRVMAEFAARPDMDLTELQNKLQATQWYNNRTQSELEWNGLSIAEQDKRREEAKARAADTWFQYTGERVDPNDPRLSNYLDQLASGKMGWGAFSQIVKDQARQNGESPYSRDLRAEQEAQRQRGIDIENTAQNVRETLRRWGLSWTDSMIMDWSRQIVEKLKSDDDLLQSVKQQAQVMYPWKDPELETLQAAQPWLQVYERRMEKVADLSNPQVQAALVAGQTPWDFEKQLKGSSQWLTTRNARQELTETGFEVAKRMGFA